MMKESANENERQTWRISALCWSEEKKMKKHVKIGHLLGVVISDVICKRRPSYRTMLKANN